MIHQEGHVETRKKYDSTWTIEEIGNVEADIVAGDAIGWVQKQDEEVWEGVEELDGKYMLYLRK
jgi:hypothetical protein